MSDKQYITDLENTNDRLIKEKDALSKEVEVLEEKIAILSNRLSIAEHQLYITTNQRQKELERQRELDRPPWPTMITRTTNHTGPFLPNHMELP